jgi:hypothetical protein
MITTRKTAAKAKNQPTRVGIIVGVSCTGDTMKIDKQPKQKTGKKTGMSDPIECVERLLGRTQVYQMPGMWVQERKGGGSCGGCWWWCPLMTVGCGEAWWRRQPDVPGCMRT